MEQQCGREETRGNIGPVDFVIKCVELSAVVEGIQYERDETENIKVNRARGVPAANENEQPDKKIQEPNDAEIIFDRSRLFRRRCDQRRFKFFAVARQFVTNLIPKPRSPQLARYLC